MKEDLEILIEQNGVVGVIFYALMLIVTIISICKGALGGMVIAMLLGIAGMIATIVHSLR